MHRIFYAISGAALLVSVLACGVGSSNEPTNDETSSTGTIIANDKLPALGQVVRDGKFEFVVNKINCGETSIGLSLRAQGQYCIVNLNVKNIGNEAKAFSTFNQLAFDDQNRKFEADGLASSLASENVGIWDNINPGNGVQANLVFDVPTDVTLTHLKLHDSAFSSGVEVGLK